MGTSSIVMENLWMVFGLIALAVALTFVVFHWNKFEEGYEKGEAADPESVARNNPPDEWSKSHWLT